MAGLLLSRENGLYERVKAVGDLVERKEQAEARLAAKDGSKGAARAKGLLERTNAKLAKSFENAEKRLAAISATLEMTKQAVFPGEKVE